MALTRITSGIIADNTIGLADIADNAVDATKIAQNSILTRHIDDNQITNAHMADDAIGIAELSATGTASSSTYLRGDNAWTAISTPITALNNATANELVTVGSTTTELDAESNLTFDGSTLTVTGEVSMTTLDIGGTNVTSTAAELNYVDGVTSAIQTQMDTKTSTGKAIIMAMVFG